MTNYTVPPRRDLISRVVREVDDFASWLLYGSETWLVALLKGVPLFLFMYFVLGYIPNYANTITTLYLGFSKDVGYLVAIVLVGGPTSTLLLILALWTHAARERPGPRAAEGPPASSPFPQRYGWLRSKLKPAFLD